MANSEKVQGTQETTVAAAPMPAAPGRPLVFPKGPTGHRQFTVEQVKALVTVKEIVVTTGYEFIPSADGSTFVTKPTKVTVTKESDLTPQMIVGGPNDQGEVNGYTLMDGFTAYFDKQTGNALGREIRIPVLKRGGPPARKLPPPSANVNRQYLAR